jgi:hypothetical protein
MAKSFPKWLKNIQTQGKREEEKPKPTKVDLRHKVLNASAWIRTGKWVNVRSSNVKSIQYDFVTKTLHVEFKDKAGGGRVYAYWNVPQFTAKAMFNSPSMGKFVWKRLRGKYSYTPL